MSEKTTAVQTRAKATAGARQLGGYRRCGVRHGLAWETWAAGAFTAAQLAILEADARVEVRAADEAAVATGTKADVDGPADFDQLVLTAIAELPSDGFTKSNKPKTDALETALRFMGHKIEVSAEDRDRLWEIAQAAAVRPE